MVRIVSDFVSRLVVVQAIHFWKKFLDSQLEHLVIFHKTHFLKITFFIGAISVRYRKSLQSPSIKPWLSDRSVYPMKSGFSKSQENMFFLLSAPIGQSDCLSSSCLVLCEIVIVTPFSSNLYTEKTCVTKLSQLS